MITGYFYSDTVIHYKEKQQIKKISCLVVEPNLLFLICNMALNILKKYNLVTYIRLIFTGKNILMFSTLNESPLAGDF